jgi:hypothetical protein
MERLVCRGSRVHGIILGKARVPPQLTAFRRRPVGRAVYFGALNSITRVCQGPDAPTWNFIGPGRAKGGLPVIGGESAPSRVCGALATSFLSPFGFRTVT